LTRELRRYDPAGRSLASLQRLATARKVKTGELVFSAGEKAHEIVILTTGALEVTRPLETITACLNLPRHHLNIQKGDKYVFEEQPQRRVRQCRAGAVFGAVEFATSVNNSQSSGVLHQSTVRAVEDSEVFTVPFSELDRLEYENTTFALVLRTWVSRLAADALCRLNSSEHEVGLRQPNSSAVHMQIPSRRRRSQMLGELSFLV